MNFLTGFWYAAGWSSEITTRPLARRILDQPVVLYRTEGGQAVALDDCCPHRMVPLSYGTVEGESLRCGYHGLRFDCAGRCVEVPGQTSIPPRARVRAWPLVERWQFAWVWMGNPEAADPALIPDLPWLDSPQWTCATGCVTYACNYVLLLDNLIDLSHTSFVHRSTIGTDAVARTPVKTAAEGDCVRVEREMHDTEPSRLYQKAGDFKGRVDRWQRIDYWPPSRVVIDAGAVSVDPAEDGRRINTRVINIITPETSRSTFHFWAFARDFKLDDRSMTDFIGDSLLVTFNEDRVLIDHQQRMLDERPQQRMLDNSADLGVVLARRMIDRLLRDQAAASGAD